MARGEGDPPALGDWSDPRRTEDYLAREIPHRAMAEAMLVEALPARVERFLDLGTGDGRLLALVREARPDARGVGLDSSAPMLARARERFRGDERVELRRHDLNEPLGEVGPVDAVVSALAIHHLPNTRKRALSVEVHELLRPGGTFVNLDLVTAATPERHRRFRDAIGRDEDDPADRLADLAAQLDWLERAGFGEVECEFKWLELALVVSVRTRA